MTPLRLYCIFQKFLIISDTSMRGLGELTSYYNAESKIQIRIGDFTTLIFGAGRPSVESREILQSVTNRKCVIPWIHSK